MKNAIDAILPELYALNAKGLLGSNGMDTVLRLQATSDVLRKLEDSDRPMRISKMVGCDTLDAGLLAAAAKRLVKAGVIRRVELGEETIKITPIWEKRQYDGTYSIPDPFTKTVDVIGFKLV